MGVTGLPAPALPGQVKSRFPSIARITSASRASHASHPLPEHRTHHIRNTPKRVSPIGALPGEEPLPEHRTHHIRNTPKRVSPIGAFSAAESESASTSRVRAGWTMPSSHSRALA